MILKITALVLAGIFLFGTCYMGDNFKPTIDHIPYNDHIFEPGHQHPSEQPGEQEPSEQEPGEQEPGEQEPGEQEPGEEPGEQPGEQEPIVIPNSIKYGTPAINGDFIDPLWANAEEYSIVKIHQDGYTQSGQSNSFRKSSSTYRTDHRSYNYGVAKALWDENGLYIFVRVADNHLTSSTSNVTPNGTSSVAYASDRHDSVEVLLNERGNTSSLLTDIADYRNDGSGKAFGGLYRLAARGMRSNGFVGGTGTYGTTQSNNTLNNKPLDGDESGITVHSAFLIDANHELAVDGKAGYVVIFRAPWVAKDTYAPVNGKKIGLEFQINACGGMDASTVATGGSLTIAGSNGRFGTTVWNDDLENGVFHENNVSRYAEMTLVGKP